MPTPTLEELLRSSLKGVDEGFKTATVDLHEEVVRAASALKNVSAGLVKLELDRERQTEDGVLYSLRVRARSHTENICWFNVSIKGYPIEVAESRQVFTGTGGEVKTLNDRSELAGFFSQMASNPDSALVQKSAFLMRAE